MTIDERITTALLPFGDDIENVVSTSRKGQYYAFNYTTIPADHGDDAPQHERHLVQVHFIAPLGMNISKRKKETKQALFHAGFTWPATTDVSDEDKRHLVFECEIADADGLEGDETDGDDDNDGH